MSWSYEKCGYQSPNGNIQLNQAVLFANIRTSMAKVLVQIEQHNVLHVNCNDGISDGINPFANGKCVAVRTVLFIISYGSWVEWCEKSATGETDKLVWEKRETNESEW